PRPRRPGAPAGCAPSYGLVLPVPGDRALEPVVELDLRLESEQLPCLVRVRDTKLDVRVVEGLEDEIVLESRQALDAKREVVDRARRACVADVEALADRVRMLERQEERLDHVVDVAPCANLRAVAVDDERLPGERRLDEGTDRASADLAWPVHVERPH